MTRINTNAPSPKFHEVEAQTTEAAHVKPSAPPSASTANVVDEFVSGRPNENRSDGPVLDCGARTFRAADLERMSPSQRAQTVGASAVQSAVYPAVEEEDPYPLSEQTYRKQMTEMSQYNRVSQLANNGSDICAACSVVNAMILSVGDEGQGSAALANALRNVFDRSKAELPPPLKKSDADRALKALESGKVSELDVEVLQQIVNAALVNGQRAVEQIVKTGDHKPGIGDFVLGSFVKALVGEGAPLEGATFELSENSKGKHWTTTRNGVHADSAPDTEARKEIGRFSA